MGKFALPLALVGIAVFLTCLVSESRGGAEPTIAREPVILAGSGVDQTISSADGIADAMASINIDSCLSRTAFDPSRRTPSQEMMLAYLRAGGFRHVRDNGFGPICYNQDRYDSFWAAVSKMDGITRVGSIGTAYTLPQIASLARVVPGLDALEFANEWDSARQPYDGYLKLAQPALAGDLALDLGSRNALSWTVPGQSYDVGNGSDAENVTLASSLPSTFNRVQLSAALSRNHALGESVRRVGDFVGDILDWYRIYAPVVKKEQPGLMLLGPAMAHPIDNEIFAKDSVSLSNYVDILNAHPYPVNGENPEGIDGDGYRGSVPINHPPCSYGGTSYSFAFNVTCEESRELGSSRVAKPIWITEYSYQVVPVGALYSQIWPHAIPDDVAVDYLTASELFATTHGVSRLYWFQMNDGTSGPGSSFCTYGLIRDSACSPLYDKQPMPKPEFLALLALIGYFSDRKCTFPSCRLGDNSFEAKWDPDILPLNTLNARFDDGRVVMAFWLGSRSYNANSKEPCAATTNCYVPVSPRAEHLSSSIILHSHKVYLTGIDDDPHDPEPRPMLVIPPDGLGAITIIKCPNGPTEVPTFGCILPYKAIQVHNGSIDVKASRRLQWIVIE